MILIFSLLIAAAVGGGGYWFTRRYFKDKDGQTEYPRKKKILFAAATLLIFAAVSVLLPLLTDPQERSIFEALRAVSAILGLYYAAVIDWKFQLIPNRYLLGFLVLTLILLGAEAVTDFPGFRTTIVLSLIGSAVCGGIFLLTNLLSHNGLGMGDVKLVFILGLMLGLDDTLAGLLWTFVFSAIAGIILLIRKKAKMKTKIPMGPFFFLGFLFSNIMYIISGFSEV